MSELRDHLKNYANKFELESDLWVINNELFDRNKALVAQRDELLAAVKNAWTNTPDGPCANRLLAIIKKVEQS